MMGMPTKISMKVERATVNTSPWTMLVSETETSSEARSQDAAKEEADDGVQQGPKNGRSRQQRRRASNPPLAVEGYESSGTDDGLDGLTIKPRPKKRQPASTLRKNKTEKIRSTRRRRRSRLAHRQTNYRNA